MSRRRGNDGYQTDHIQRQKLQDSAEAKDVGFGNYDDLNDEFGGASVTGKKDNFEFINGKRALKICLTEYFSELRRGGRD